MRVEYTKHGEAQESMLYFTRTGDRVGFEALLNLKKTLDEVEKTNVTQQGVITVPMHFIIGDDVLLCEYQLSYDNGGILAHTFDVKKESIDLEPEYLPLLDATHRMFTMLYENLYFVI